MLGNPGGSIPGLTGKAPSKAYFSWVRFCSACLQGCLSVILNKGGYEPRALCDLAFSPFLKELAWEMNIRNAQIFLGEEPVLPERMHICKHLGGKKKVTLRAWTGRILSVLLTLQIPHMCEIIWYLSCSDWLISLSIIYSRSIHAVKKGSL